MRIQSLEVVCTTYNTTYLTFSHKQSRMIKLRHWHFKFSSHVQSSPRLRSTQYDWGQLIQKYSHIIANKQPSYYSMYTNFRKCFGDWSTHWSVVKQLPHAVTVLGPAILLVSTSVCLKTPHFLPNPKTTPIARSTQFNPTSSRGVSWPRTQP